MAKAKSRAAKGSKAEKPAKAKARPARPRTLQSGPSADVEDAFERDGAEDADSDADERASRLVVPELVSPDEDLEGLDSAELGDESLEAVEIEPEDFDGADRPGLPEPRDKASAGRTSSESSSRALAPVDPVAAYLAEIRKYPLLTREEERELAVRYRETGDPKAAERLVTSNLRFVVKIAAEYTKFGAKLIDLVQEGNVGLMHAVRDFNPYKDVRLITYAVWWIRGYIQEYLMRQYSLVRIGTTQNQRKLFYRLQKERAALDSLGQEPNVALLSSRLGVPADEVEAMSKRLSGRDVSLNQPLDPDSKTTLIDMERGDGPGVDEAIGRREELEVLRQGIDSLRGKLTEKETYILENRLLSDEPMTLQEIGDKYGVTREAVRQIEARLMNRLKSAVMKNLEPRAADADDVAD